MTDHLFITPADLFATLMRRDAPRVLDLRDAGDAAADPRGIPAARACALVDLDAISIMVPVICSCQRGGKLSQMAAAHLRAGGVDARTLIGGHLAWCDAGLPMVSTERPARWVMPIDPDWSGLATLWLLHRLIDRDAPVRALERAWLPQAAEIWDAAILPPDPGSLAARVGLSLPILSRLTGGPEALLAGRLTHAEPIDALDLIDDWLARPEAAA